MDEQRRVLVVDDNEVNRDILCKILRKEYVLQTAADGHECLQRSDEFQPQLVLLDVMMPGLDGYEVCRRLKNDLRRRFCQVILLSGKGSLAERLQGFEARADDYIVKPFDHQELRARVRAQFRLWERCRDCPGAVLPASPSLPVSSSLPVLPPPTPCPPPAAC